MLNPGPLPQGSCRRCHRRVALQKDGLTREHRAKPGVERKCPGSWQPPKAIESVRAPAKRR